MVILFIFYFVVLTETYVGSVTKTNTENVFKNKLWQLYMFQRLRGKLCGSYWELLLLFSFSSLLCAYIMYRFRQTSQFPAFIIQIPWTIWYSTKIWLSMKISHLAIPIYLIIYSTYFIYFINQIWTGNIVYYFSIH